MVVTAPTQHTIHMMVIRRSRDPPTYHMIVICPICTSHGSHITSHGSHMAINIPSHNTLHRTTTPPHTSHDHPLRHRTHTVDGGVELGSLYQYPEHSVQVHVPLELEAHPSPLTECCITPPCTSHDDHMTTHYVTRLTLSTVALSWAASLSILNTVSRYPWNWRHTLTECRSIELTPSLITPYTPHLSHLTLLTYHTLHPSLITPYTPHLSHLTPLTYHTLHPSLITPYTPHLSHLTPLTYHTLHPSLITPYTPHLSHLTPLTYHTLHPSLITPYTPHLSHLYY